MLLTITRMEQQGCPVTVSALRGSLDLAQASITQLVRRAEDAGLLSRDVSDADARIRYLRVTASGQKRLAAAVSELSEERKQLAEILKDI